LLNHANPGGRFFFPKRFVLGIFQLSHPLKLPFVDEFPFGDKTICFLPPFLRVREGGGAAAWSPYYLRTTDSYFNSPPFFWGLPSTPNQPYTAPPKKNPRTDPGAIHRNFSMISRFPFPLSWEFWLAVPGTWISPHPPPLSAKRRACRSRGVVCGERV